MQVGIEIGDTTMVLDCGKVQASPSLLFLLFLLNEQHPPLY